MPNIIPNPTEIKIDFIGFYYLLFIIYFIVRRDVKHAIFGTSRQIELYNNFTNISNK